MKYVLKIAAVGAVAAFGLATAAVAQQGNTQRQPMTAQQHREMMSGGMMGNGQKTKMMMDNPKMRQQMTDMMASCNKMMRQMGSMQQKPKV